MRSSTTHPTTDFEKKCQLTPTHNPMGWATGITSKMFIHIGYSDILHY